MIRESNDAKVKKNMEHLEEDVLNALCSGGKLGSLDVQFARLMERLDDTNNPDLPLAAALVSRRTGQGDICLDLRRFRESLLEDDSESCFLPKDHEWLDRLRSSKVVGLPGEYKPLILDEAGRLYLYRYWEYQQKLAGALRARMGGTPAIRVTDAFKEALERQFPSTETGEVDWQKVAAFSAVWKSFCVISGGPGTGKTTTVAKILALLVGQSGSGTTRIALAAPTGKAAAKLQEAIKRARERLDCEEWVKAAIPDEASTIHRLLGSIPGNPTFRHTEENPLPVDVLLVDEASMVDLPLMSKLLQALPVHARLILLGDKDQLSSVEAGAVLGDICTTGEQIAYSTAFAEACESICGFSLDENLIVKSGERKPKDSIIQLQKSYRFSEGSGIALLSRKVRNNNAEGALEVLRKGAFPDLIWNGASSCSSLEKDVRDDVTEGFRGYWEEIDALGRETGGDPGERLRRFFERLESFRILCAVREGPCGVSALNMLAERIMEEAGFMNRDRRWYLGRPVLIRRNDYSLRLFNGDVGIFLPDLLSGPDHRVFFPGPEGTFRSFLPQRLPEHETVFAMTVHKSQGSEFDNVLLILPDRDSAVLTRELIYTAITRARKRVSLRGSEQILRKAISRSTERLSGLSEALWA